MSHYPMQAHIHDQLGANTLDDGGTEMPNSESSALSSRRVLGSRSASKRKRPKYDFSEDEDDSETFPAPSKSDENDVANSNMPMGSSGGIGSGKVVPRFHDLYTYEAELQKKESYIRQLESQLQLLQSQPRGRARSSKVPDSQVRQQPAATGMSLAKQARHFKQWAKLAMSTAKRTKTGRSYADLDVDVKCPDAAVLEFHDFKDMFLDKGGELVQPTASNKPSAQVYIVDFASYEEVAQLFGGESVIPQAGYELAVWKQKWSGDKVKCGVWEAKLQGLRVKFSKKSGALTLIFRVRK